jgi:RNA recognition motif-containing protein
MTTTEIKKNSTTSLKIFVGCIPGGSTEADIEKVFNRFGPLKSIHLERRKNNKCSGYGFIQACEKESYDQILSNRHFLGERQLSVLPYLEKNELIESQLKFNKRRIVVAQLPKETSDEDLLRHFSAFGEIEKAFVVKNKTEPGLMPYGHIIFKDNKGASKARKNRHFIRGKRVTVKTHKIDVKKKLKDIKTKKKVSSTGEKKRTVRREKRRSLDNLLLRKLDSGFSHSLHFRQSNKNDRTLSQIVNLSTEIALRNHHGYNLRLNCPQDFGRCMGSNSTNQASGTLLSDFRRQRRMSPPGIKTWSLF